MSISLDNTPAADVPAFAPIIYSGTTDRWPFDTEGDRQADEFDQLADEVKLTLEKSSGTFGFGDFWDENDTIEVTGLEGTLAKYNGLHTITAIASTTITTDTDYDDGAQLLGEDATVARRNDTLNVVVKVYDDVATELLNEIYVPVRTGGAFEVDVSRVVQQSLGSDFSLTPGAVSCDNAAKVIECEFYETFQGPDYKVFHSTLQETHDFIAHRAADITDQFGGVATKNSLHQLNFFASDKIIYKALADVVINRVSFDPDNESPTVVPVVNVYGHVMAVYEVPLGAKTVTIRAYHQESAESNIKIPVTVRIRETCTGKRLYWLNRLGGYSQMEVTKFDATKNRRRIDKYTTESDYVYAYYTVSDGDENYSYLQDIIDSPEIRDQDGNLVEVTDSNLTYRQEDVEPVITIKDKKAWIR